MSEFRVIKCKKCDASLTELKGETLSSCVQCGHKFLINKPSAKLADLAGVDVSEVTNQNKKPTPEISQLIRKLRLIKTQRTAKTASSNKKPVWGTIVKWYFIIVFSMGVLSQCFSR